jgi:hypothetical protein
MRVNDGHTGTRTRTLCEGSSGSGFSWQPRCLGKKHLHHLKLLGACGATLQVKFHGKFFLASQFAFKIAAQELVYASTVHTSNTFLDEIHSAATRSLKRGAGI